MIASAKNQAKMPGRKHKCLDPIYKDVVVIGNGPSAITLSYMLSGNAPYYKGTSTDEFLHLRMSENREESLLLQDLEFLSDGLEGRSTNPVSVLFDALSHPEADMGQELAPLLEWKHRPDLSVDHVVLGRGEPGGAWKAMSDSDMLTVSLGTWMELPNMKMSEWKPTLLEDNINGRVGVSTVAQYYRDYVKLMSLSQSFDSNTTVERVVKITDCPLVCTDKGFKEPCTKSLSNLSRDDADEENAVFQQESLYTELHQALTSSNPSTIDEADGYADDDLSSCNTGVSLTESEGSWAGTTRSRVDELAPTNNELDISRHALSATRMGQHMQSQARRRANTSCCLEFAEKSSEGSDDVRFNLSWNPIVFGCSITPASPVVMSPNSSISGKSYSWNACESRKRKKPSCPVSKCFKTPHLWQVSGTRYNRESGPEEFSYMTKNLILATGAYDRPNRLNVPGEHLPFVVHSLKEMEAKVQNGEMLTSHDPIMIVGAGLSAADAIIAARQQHLPVVHVFRREPTDRNLIFNNLPAGLYPEYHEVHRMMAGSTNTGTFAYSPYAKRHLVKIDTNREVTLHGSCLEKVKVSFVVVLIGSLPDLRFLSVDDCGDDGRTLGIIPGEPISRNNPIDIDLFSHESIKQSGIYAMGPLVGDNFVRFLQGGALAITNHILKKKLKEAAVVAEEETEVADQ